MSCLDRAQFASILARSPGSTVMFAWDWGITQLLLDRETRGATWNAGIIYGEISKSLRDNTETNCKITTAAAENVEGTAGHYRLQTSASLLDEFCRFYTRFKAHNSNPVVAAQCLSAVVDLQVTEVPAAYFPVSWSLATLALFMQLYYPNWF